MIAPVLMIGGVGLLRWCARVPERAVQVLGRFAWHPEYSFADDVSGDFGGALADAGSLAAQQATPRSPVGSSSFQATARSPAISSAMLASFDLHHPVDSRGIDPAAAGRRPVRIDVAMRPTSAACTRVSTRALPRSTAALGHRSRRRRLARVPRP